MEDVAVGGGKTLQLIERFELLWLYATPDNMRTVLKGTGWFLDVVIEDGTRSFVGIIRKNGTEPDSLSEVPHRTVPV